MTSSSSVTNATSDSLIHARAVQAVIWGMPAVNYDLMLEEMLTKTIGSVAFIGIKNLGGGQMYLFSIKDKDGRRLRRLKDLQTNRSA
jgi:hypothetical protein